MAASLKLKVQILASFCPRNFGGTRSICQQLSFTFTLVAGKCSEAYHPRRARQEEQGASLAAALAGLPAARLADSSAYVRRVLHVPAGRRALLVNGQLVGPLGVEEPFGEDDLALLEKFTTSSYAAQAGDQAADSRTGRARRSVSRRTGRT